MCCAGRAITNTAFCQLNLLCLFDFSTSCTALLHFTDRHVNGFNTKIKQKVNTLHLSRWHVSGAQWCDVLWYYRHGQENLGQLRAKLLFLPWSQRPMFSSCYLLSLFDDSSTVIWYLWQPDGFLHLDVKWRLRKRHACGLIRGRTRSFSGWYST